MKVFLTFVDRKLKCFLFYFSSKNTNKIWTGNYRKISTTGCTIFTWFWWPERGMQLIYKINFTGKNFQSGMMSDRMYIGQSYASSPSTWHNASGRRIWRSVGCGCAWNGASVYNCHQLCHGYSVFIASLKLRKYQTVHKQWSPQQPVSTPVPLESTTSRKYFIVKRFYREEPHPATSWPRGEASA